MTDMIEFDYVVLRCNICKGKHKIYPDRAIRGAQELTDWMKIQVKKFCSCSSETCDVLAHIKGAPEIPASE